MGPRPFTGLVLRLRGLGESDLLLDLFTVDRGRVTALVKGGRRSKKRFFGILLWGHLLEGELAPHGKSGDLMRLETARLGEAHLGLRQDFRRFMAAGPVAELLLRATAPLDPHPGALAVSLATLARLARAEGAGEMASALVVHLTRLLAELGYGLSLEACLHCGRPAEAAPHLHLSPAGGVACACQGEAAGVPVPLGLVKSLAAAARLEPASLARLVLPAPQAGLAFRFLSGFWRRVCMHDLPSLDAAREVLGSALGRARPGSRS